MTPTRQIEYWPLASLQPDPANPKTHSRHTITDSINRFGYVEPVVVDGRTGLIVSGHGRTESLRASEARGDEPPEGIRVDEDGVWLAPVVTGWASTSDATARAALIAMNRTTEVGGWNDESLLDLLDQLAADETQGLDGLGYDESDLDRIRAALHGAPGSAGLIPPGEDEYPRQFAVTIPCEDEAEQEEVFAAVKALGYNPKAVSV